VISGLNVINSFGFGFEQAVEMTRAASVAAREANQRAFRIIEICRPWGEYYATIPATIPPLVYADMVIQSGIKFEAFGLEMSMNEQECGLCYRDMMQLSSVLDYFGLLNKPLYIYEVQIPGIDKAESDKPEQKDWDQDKQKQWLQRFYEIALSKPFIDVVGYGNLTDSKGKATAATGLMTEKLEPKKALEVIEILNRRISGR